MSFEGAMEKSMALFFAEQTCASTNKLRNN